MAAKYKVGYGKPPEHTRFRQGQCGNPKGRPKGRRNLITDLLEELAQRIRLVEGGCEKRVNKQQALLKGLFARAIKNSDSAARTLLDMILRHESQTAPSEREPLGADEAAVLEAYKARIRRGTGSDEGDDEK